MRLFDLQSKLFPRESDFTREQASSRERDMSVGPFSLVGGRLLILLGWLSCLQGSPGSTCGHLGRRVCCRAGLIRLRGGFLEPELKDNFRQGSPSRIAVKRIKSEITDLEENPCNFFRARPLDTDLLDWHFVLLGANNTVYEGGVYHGQIQLDQEYPIKPPRIIFLTESGRFEVGVPICLSITSHHAETWQPVWDIRLCLTALQVKAFESRLVWLWRQ